LETSSRTPKERGEGKSIKQKKGKGEEKERRKKGITGGGKKTVGLNGGGEGGGKPMTSEVSIVLSAPGEEKGRDWKATEWKGKKKPCVP